MSATAIRCAWCFAEALKEVGAVNRARAAGLWLYCDRACAGLARRQEKTASEKVAAKAEYDRQYRAANRAKLKAKKAVYFQATYDPKAAAIARKERMPRHVEYCRRPEYRKWKAEYDRQYLARKGFGDFSEAAILLNVLETEIRSRASWLEIAHAKGTINKHQNRRRDYDRQTQCR